MWGANYTLGEKWTPINSETGEAFKTKDKKDYKMPADFFPIKTYVDYGLDKDPDEELKTDPITPLLEFMGSIGKGEHMWYQIIIQDEGVYKGTSKFPKFYVNSMTHDHVSLSDMAETYKKQLRISGYKKKGEFEKDEYGDIKEKTIKKDGKETVKPLKYEATKAIPKKDTDLTSEEKEKIDAINRKLSKPLMCGVIRLLYVTDKDSFKGGAIQYILAHGRPYTSANSFGFTVTDPYDYPWQKIGGKVEWRTEEKFEAYVEREGFYPHIPAGDEARKGMDSWEDVTFRSSTLRNRRIFRMMYEAIFYPFSHPHPTEVSTYNLEELATLWHFPGAVAGTPTLPRIDSVKGVAPTNLPI
jgi:hypothetical protein